jgi:hypothetical protein
MDLMVLIKISGLFPANTAVVSIIDDSLLPRGYFGIIRSVNGGI